MLTIKSDDVKGRGRAFEAMVKGEEIPAPTVPESFKVLVRELNSLGLDVIPHEVEEQIEEVKPSAEATTDDAVATDDTTTDDDDTAATDDTTDDAVADDTADVKEEVEAVESTEEKLNTDTKEQE